MEFGNIANEILKSESFSKLIKNSYEYINCYLKLIEILEKHFGKGM